MKTLLYFTSFLLLVASSMGPSVTSAPVHADVTGPWYPAYITITSCPEFPITNADSEMVQTGDLISITANKQQRGGVSVNSWAGQYQPYQGSGFYTLGGQFKKGPGDPENISVNFRWVDQHHIEHFSELVWVLNPYSPLRGKVWFRNAMGFAELFDLPDDEAWHTFSFTALHSGDNHTLTQVTVDGQTREIELPLGTARKSYENRMSILLKVQNMYPNCDPSLVTTATAFFKDINFSFLPEN